MLIDHSLLLVPLIPSPMLVVYPGDFARFDCPSGITQRSTTAITWFLNGTSFTNLSLGNVTADLARTTAGHIESGILRFAAVPVEYNMTSVHCRAEFTTGNPVTSPMSVLLVQGQNILMLIPITPFPDSLTNRMGLTKADSVSTF